MPPTSTSPASDLNRFIARYTPNIAKLARGALARMRNRLPAAHQLVYDNYNTCAIGFSPTERASDVIFSITLYRGLGERAGSGLTKIQRAWQGCGGRLNLADSFEPYDQSRSVLPPQSGSRTTLHPGIPIPIAVAVYDAWEPEPELHQAACSGAHKKRSALTLTAR